MQWGPEGRRAAISVTFDNLGEAEERQRGSWPEERPLGQHPSVTEALPSILSLLDELDLRATFFVEGVNTEVYPDALADIAGRGHEIAYHAWCHEMWGGLEPDEERRLLERGVAAMRERELELRGFRPPGGALTDASPGLLRELGFEYASPAGQRAGVSDGLALLPFRWQAVDAFYYMPEFGGLREAAGASEDPLGPRALRQAAEEELGARVERAEHGCLLFHPFLSLEDDRRDALRALLEKVAGLDAWCAPAGQVAAWMLQRPEDFGSPDLTPLPEDGG
jgi:peptidoglycan/xylan/chitin deacetylase (PgdA/CDA1 family)